MSQNQFQTLYYLGSSLASLVHLTFFILSAFSMLIAGSLTTVINFNVAGILFVIFGIYFLYKYVQESAQVFKYYQRVKKENLQS